MKYIIEELGQEDVKEIVRVMNEQPESIEGRVAKDLFEAASNVFGTVDVSDYTHEELNVLLNLTKHSKWRISLGTRTAGSPVDRMPLNTVICPFNRCASCCCKGGSLHI